MGSSMEGDELFDFSGEDPWFYVQNTEYVIQMLPG